MKNNTFTNKEIFIFILIGIILYALKAVLPLLILIGIVLFIKSRKTPKIDTRQRKRPIETLDTFEIEKQKADLAECEELIASEKRLREEADLRQFKGRSDVTKEELAQYMYEQRKWDGIHERHVHMEEIIKSCNLTMDDVAWVEQELQHYHFNKNNPEQTADFKCCYVRDEEEKAITEYQNEKEKGRITSEIRKEEQEFNEHLAFYKELGFNDDVITNFQNAHNKVIDTYNESLRKVDYESWLEKKGYTNGQNI